MAKCRNCNGTGEVTSFTDVLFGALTLGVNFAMGETDPDVCPKCNGTGKDTP